MIQVLQNNPNVLDDSSVKGFIQYLIKEDKFN
jgi:hypothetical protein